MQGQQPEDHKNLLIAVLLSMAVLIGWQVFFPPERPPAPPKSVETTVDGTTVRDAVPGAQDGGQGVVARDGAAPTPAAAGGVAAPDGTTTAAGGGASSGQRVAVKTESLEGSIALRGGRIDDLKLVKYFNEVDPESGNVVLFRPSNSARPYFAEFGWVASGGSTQKMPGRDTVWQLTSGQTLSAGAPVELTWNNGTGLTFKRTISLDDGYMFTVSDRVENASGSDVVLFPYARVYRYGTPKIEGFFIQHEGLIGWLGETALQELTYADLLEPGGTKRFDNIEGGWIGFTDKYWASAIVPDQSRRFTATMKAIPRSQGQALEAYQSDYLLDGMTLANGQAIENKSLLFAGAKNVGLIEGYEAEYSILEFNYLVDWGWFYFITKPLYHLLDWLFGLFGNFGLAILGVTVIVKLLFFPLANKAYESMAKMKKMQPEMEKLRERFKDDKQRQQQELMKLYQEQKINPLAGCLPILLQIPVFFALYKVLFVSIDMRHAPFYGWINDLSAPDPTSLFNLFGLLPYDVPQFLMVGVWPLIMGVTMWLQMQLNPKQPDPTQQMIFNWMPVMFTFLLATFPAGLVIYWAWNNVLSLMQQYYIMKRQGADIPLLENIKETFASIGNIMPGKKND